MYTDDRRSRGQSERINFLSVHLAAAASFVIERRKLNSTRLLQSAVNYLSIPHFWTSANNSVNLHKGSRRLLWKRPFSSARNFKQD